jgi:WD40 repeat protein
MLDLDRIERSLRCNWPLLGGWIRRRAARDLTTHWYDEAVRLKAHVLAGHPDPEVVAIIREHLRAETRVSTRTLLCELWTETRSPALAELLHAWDWLPAKPLSLRVFCALLLDRTPGVIASSEEDRFGVLLSACDDADTLLAGRARHALETIPDVPTREAFLRYVLAAEHALGQEIARAAEYEFSTPEGRALRLFLTDQTEAYEALDFDRRLLREAFATAPDNLRQRVVEKIRRSGRVDWLDVLAPSTEASRPSRISTREWETMLDVLVRREQGEKIWHMALAAPLSWSARFLTALGSLAWQPPVEPGKFAQFLDCARTWLRVQPPNSSRGTGVLQAHASPVECLTISPDGRWLASGDSTGKILLWDLDDLRHAGRLEEGEGAVSLLLFGPHGWPLVSCHLDHVVRVWDRHDAPESRYRQLLAFAPNCLAIHPQEARLAVCSLGRIWCWDLQPGHKHLIPDLDAGLQLDRVAFSPNGRHLVAAGPQFLVLADVYTYKWSALPLSASAPVRHLWFDETGKRILLQRGTRPWEVHDARTLQPVALEAKQSWVLWPDFDPDLHTRQSRRRSNLVPLGRDLRGRRLAARSKGKRIRVWCPDNGHILETLDGHTANITCLAAHPESQLLVSGDSGGTIRLWSLPASLQSLTAVPVSQLKLHDWQRVQERLERRNLDTVERAALELLDLLLALRWRDAVEVEDVFLSEFGEFDIEIDEE